MSPIAAEGHLGIRKESSFASGGAVDDWQPFDSETVQLNRDHAYGDRIQATAEQVGGTNIRRSGAGTITFGISPQNPVQWWECALGQTTSPYSESRPLSSMLLQIDRETAAVQASGCMVGSTTISSTQGSGPDTELKCAVNIEAKDIADVSAGSPSFTSGDAPFVHSEGVFKLNGSVDENVTAWSVTMDNALAADLYGSARTRVAITATKLTVTGSFTKLFETTTERDAFLAGDARSFQATFTRGTRTFDVNIAKMKYDNRAAPLSGQTEYIMETFNFTAYVDDASTENSVVITVDTT